MGQWRGKYLDTGPPRGPGHYSDDGHWWWDDTHRRWFRTLDQEEVLEIEAEDVGGVSLAASLLTTLSSQYGNGYFRFLARARSPDPRWPTYAMAGATFPGTRPSPETSAPRVPGWRPSANASRSCISSCSLRGGGRPVVGPIGGRPSTGGRTSTGTPRPMPTNGRRGAHDAGAGDGGDQVRRHRRDRPGDRRDAGRARAGGRGPPARAGRGSRRLRRGGGGQRGVRRALAEAGPGAGRASRRRAGRPVWLFSSGPVGDPPKPEEDPVDVADLLAATGAREHRVFAGKLVRKQLSFPERAIVSALRVPEGDFRDWTEIRQWAAGIADALEAGSSPAAEQER